MHLNKAKFLITLIFQYFTEQSDIMVILLMILDTIDDCDEPLNNQILETVFLI